MKLRCTKNTVPFFGPPCISHLRKEVITSLESILSKPSCRCFTARITSRNTNSLYSADLLLSLRHRRSDHQSQASSAQYTKRQRAVDIGTHPVIDCISGHVRQHGATTCNSLWTSFLAATERHETARVQKIK